MANIGMVQSCDCVSLAVEAFAETFSANFDGHIAAEPRIASAIDFPHPARAERHHDLIGAKLCAWSEKHKWP